LILIAEQNWLSDHGYLLIEIAGPDNLDAI